jgi:hypothetical protein
VKYSAHTGQLINRYNFHPFSTSGDPRSCGSKLVSDGIKLGGILDHKYQTKTKNQLAENECPNKESNTRVHNEVG